MVMIYFLTTARDNVSTFSSVDDFIRKRHIPNKLQLGREMRRNLNQIPAPKK
jgi:hypothetical protein